MIERLNSDTFISSYGTIMFYEYAKGTGNLFEREIEGKFWSHPAKVVEITAAQEENKLMLQSKHTVQLYTAVRVKEWEPE
jgi:hypothetical protein